MTEQYTYPTSYELEQALGEFCPRHFVDQFAQVRGVFVTNTGQAGLIQVLSRLLYEHHALESIRFEALQFNAKSTLAGFVAISDNSDFNLVDTFEILRGDAVDPATNMNLGPIILSQGGDQQVFKGLVNYTQWKPGRVQFLQGSPRSFDYYINRIDSNRWRLLVDCGRSNDARLMRDWVRKNVPREVRLDEIEQDQLTTQQTIHFFDNLSNRALDDAWQFTQVRRLALQRASEQTSDGSEDEERVETRPSVLSGITQAILEGEGLRTNPFVKECEEGGYRFTAMTYEFDHKTQPYLVEIRAEFKGKPKVFEVAIDNYRRRVGLGERLEETSLPADRKISILARFWSHAKLTFDELQAEQL